MFSKSFIKFFEKLRIFLLWLPKLIYHNFKAFIREYKLYKNRNLENKERLAIEKFYV